MFYRKFVIMACVGMTWLALTARPAQAAARLTRHPSRYFAYEYALAQQGKWYCWGGTGPSCYDCSGLVWAAYRSVHIMLPRTTYEMLDSRQLVRISKAQARRGDLAFYGTGHVELVDRRNITFGAHATGQQIGWMRIDPYWHPTAYYRVRGAGLLRAAHATRGRPDPTAGRGHPRAVTAHARASDTRCRTYV